MRESFIRAESVATDDKESLRMATSDRQLFMIVDDVKLIGHIHKL